MAGDEQRGWRAGHRGEAFEQGTEAKYNMQEQHPVEEAARQDETCKSQTEGKPDLECGRFGEYIKHLEERWAKLEDRLTAHVEAEIESRAAQWRDNMVQAWWSKSPQEAEQEIEAGF